MTNKKNKKTARQKRTLVLALLVAATIAAGSTFAWFTSKDEVTNRLSASAKYDVSIAEDFQPPEDWVPGQTINKDVSAVNTGNVDAFVRMWLGGQMRLLAEDATPSIDAKSASLGLATTNAVTDTSKTALGLNYYKDGKYYRTLSTEKISNANDSAHPGTENEETNAPGMFSEVQSVQAGGVLVYAPTNAAYHWTLEQATELPVFTAGDSTATPPTDDDVTMTNLAKGTVVGNSTTGVSGATKLAPASATDSNYYGAIDASTFTPETTGLYLFRRNVGETADGTANTYEYSGYYYDAALNKYFALHTGTGANGHSDYVLPTSAVTENNSATPSADQVLPVTVEANKVYLYTASEQVLDNATNKLKWEYQDAVTTGAEASQHPARFVVSYGAGDNAIKINIDLANIGDKSEEWTAIKDNDTATTQLTTFYYNNDVEAGDTTTKLVDSVTLSKDTDNAAYLAFDFDLNVFLDSVQVTMDENGKELTTPVAPWNATAPALGATGSCADTGSEIETIAWAKS